MIRVGCLYEIVVRSILCAGSGNNELVFVIQPESLSELHSEVLYLYSFMISMLRVTDGESMSPRPCLPILKTPCIYCFTACLFSAIFISDRYYYLQSSIPLAFYYLFTELVRLYI